MKFSTEFSNNLLTIIKWIATILMTASAISISFFIEAAQYTLPFIGFGISHLLWSSAAIVMKDKPLLCLNLAFLMLDIYAIAIRL